MTEQTKIGVTRRTLAKGAAWSVPSIAVAAAAPAYAKSVPDIEIDWGSSSGCKIPGASHKNLCYDKGYVLYGVFENHTDHSIDVTITGITVGGVARCLVGLSDYEVSCTTRLTDNKFTIEPNSTRKIAVWGNSSTDSSSTNVTVYFDYTIGNTTISGQDKTSADIGGSPIQGGSCKRPAGCGTTPMTACGTGCATNQTVIETQEAEPAVEEQAAETPKPETQKAEEPAPAPEPKAEEPAPAPEPKAEEPAPAPEPSEPADEA